MKTTIDIPEKLLRSVVKHTKAATKREAVLTALEDFDRRRRLRELSQMLGTSETFMTHEELMAMREMDLHE